MNGFKKLCHFCGLSCRLSAMLVSASIFPLSSHPAVNECTCLKLGASEARKVALLDNAIPRGGTPRRSYPAGDLTFLYLLL